MYNTNGKHAAPPAQPFYDGVLPPSNQEAEEAVLGSLLIDPEMLVLVAPTLPAEAFYHQRNKEVYAAMCALDSRHEPIDFLTVAQELRRAGKSEPDSDSFLAGLTNTIATSLNVEAYAARVVEAFTRRRMLAAANVIVKQAYAATQPIDECVATAGRALMDVQQDRNTGTTTSAKEAVGSLMARIQFMNERLDKTALLGLSTGFIDWDQMTSGSQAGDLILVAARPSMGKSALLKDLAVTACKAGKRAAFFSLETSTEQLMTRVISGETGIDLQRLRMGELRNDEWSCFTQASTRVSDWHLQSDDGVGLTVPALRAKVNRIYQRHGLDLILVDYLQLMQGSAENRVQEVGQISAGLKQIAREFNVPLIAAAQLSRNVESRPDKHPMLSDLRDSGSLEQDADVVAFIYRDEYYNAGTDQESVADINIAKNRNGPTGTLKLFFDKRLTTFRNLSRERIEL